MKLVEHVAVGVLAHEVDEPSQPQCNGLIPKAGLTLYSSLAQLQSVVWMSRLVHRTADSVTGKQGASGIFMYIYSLIPQSRRIIGFDA